MTDSNFQIMEVSRDIACCWFEESLAGGFDLSAAALARNPFQSGRFYTFVPSDLPVEKLEFPEGEDVPFDVAVAGLAKFLDDLISGNASSLLVEDDLADPSDPGLRKMTTPSSFVGEKVIHWCQLRAGIEAVRAVRESAMGYPLNAFVSSKSVTELGLVNYEAASEELPEKVSSSLLAVVVAAFDATSFAVWDSRD